MSTFTLRSCAVILFLVIFMNLIFGIDFKARDGYKQLQRCSPFLFSYQSLHFEPKSISGIRFLFNSKLILILFKTLSTLGRECDMPNYLASRHYPYFFSDQYIFWELSQLLILPRFQFISSWVFSQHFIPSFTFLFKSMYSRDGIAMSSSQEENTSKSFQNEEGILCWRISIGAPHFVKTLLRWKTQFTNLSGELLSFWPWDYWRPDCLFSRT